MQRERLLGLPVVCYNSLKLSFLYYYITKHSHKIYKSTKQSIAKSPECCFTYVLHLVAIVTTRRTEHREMADRKLLSSKMRKKLSQRRASRSRKQQKPQLPPRGNAAEQRAARPWTWVLQLTTLETEAQRRRYSHEHSHFYKCELYF